MIKREQEEGLILIPFKTKRFEHWNDNGEKKQVELEKRLEEWKKQEEYISRLGGSHTGR